MNTENKATKGRIFKPNRLTFCINPTGDKNVDLNMKVNELEQNKHLLKYLKSITKYSNNGKSYISINLNDKIPSEEAFKEYVEVISKIINGFDLKYTYKHFESITPYNIVYIHGETSKKSNKKYSFIDEE